MARRTLSHRLFDLIAIDLRSLAAFRIATAVLLLADLAFRIPSLAAHLTDSGVLPRVARIELYELSDQFRNADMWSFHMLSGQFWVQLLMFAAAGVAATSLLVGYRTKLSTIVSWVLLLSLHSRNPMIINSGDVLLRSMLFWSLFLPLGACFSLDRRLGKKAPPTEQSVASVAAFGMLLQPAMMYFFSALFKSHHAWTTEASGIYYALNCDSYVTQLGLWLREFPAWVHRAMTRGTFALELFGPIVVFIPWRMAVIRSCAIIVFWLFHLGLALTMTIGLFPAICMVAWLVFVPGAVWDRLGRTKPTSSLPPMGVEAPELAADQDLVKQVADSRPMPVRIATVALNLLLAVILTYTVVWNVRELDFKRWEWLLPRQYNGPARVLGLDQNWSMFAPIPRTEDGWLVMRGVLRDGSEVNLWDFGQPLPWDKPTLVSATYKSQRWRKYLDNLTTEPYGLHRIHFVNWLQQRWNAKFAEGDPEREVVEAQLVQRLEITPPPGEEIPEPESRVLLTWYYE